MAAVGLQVAPGESEFALPATQDQFAALTHDGEMEDAFLARFQLGRWNLDQLVAFAAIQFRQFGNRESQ